MMLTWILAAITYFVTTHWPEPLDKVIFSVALQLSSCLNISWHGKPLGHRHRSWQNPLANFMGRFLGLTLRFDSFDGRGQCVKRKSLSLFLPSVYHPCHDTPHEKFINTLSSILHRIQKIHRLSLALTSMPGWADVIAMNSMQFLDPMPPPTITHVDPTSCPSTYHTNSGWRTLSICTNLLHLHQHQRWWSDHDQHLCMCKVTPLLHTHLPCGYQWHQNWSCSCPSWFDTPLAQVDRLDCSLRYHWLATHCNWQIHQTALQWSPPWCHQVRWHVIVGIQLCNKESRWKNSPSRLVQVWWLVSVQS